MNPQEHYFSFSALDSFWEKTNHMAQSFTANAMVTSPKASRTMAKPPLSPRGQSGRPPLSPTTTTHASWEESVETVLLSPRSIDDVRLFTVRDLKDLPDLYDFARPPSDKKPQRQQQQRQQQPTLPCLDHSPDTKDAPSDTHSLDFTHDGTSSVEVTTPRDEGASWAEASGADGEEQLLLGLTLVEQPEEPAMELDLDFLKHDPPQAHVRRGVRK